MGWHVIDEYGNHFAGPYKRRDEAITWGHGDNPGYSVVWQADEENESTSNSSSGFDGSGIVLLVLCGAFLCLRSCYLNREHVEKTYYNNGNIKSEQTYKNRKLNGVSKFYFNDSNKKLKKFRCIEMVN